IDGQNLGSLQLQHLDQFVVRGNRAWITGPDPALIYDGGEGIGGGGYLSVNANGIYGSSAEYGKIDFTTAYLGTVHLASQIDYGYAGTPVLNQMDIDSSGTRFSVYSQLSSTSEYFRFG